MLSDPAPDNNDPTRNDPSDDVITTYTETPPTPKWVDQINVVIDHTEGERTLRHMFVLDNRTREFTETEIGLVDTYEVFIRDRTAAEWRSGQRVHVPAIGETMDLERYARMVGEDEPEWRLGSGFEEAADDGERVLVTL